MPVLTYTGLGQSESRGHDSSDITRDNLFGNAASRYQQHQNGPSGFDAGGNNRARYQSYGDRQLTQEEEEVRAMPAYTDLTNLQ